MKDTVENEKIQPPFRRQIESTLQGGAKGFEYLLSEEKTREIYCDLYLKEFEGFRSQFET